MNLRFPEFPAMILFILFLSSISHSSTNSVPPFDKPDLNRAAPAVIRKVLSGQGLDTAAADKIISFRNRRGEIFSFEELVEAGLTQAQVEHVREYFTIHTSRKDPDEVMKKWNVSDPGFFYGLTVYPMDLNGAEEEDLAELPCFGREGSALIAGYRMTNEIAALLELTNAGLGREKLLEASPFVTLKPVADNGFTMNADIRYQARHSVTSGEGAADNGETEIRTAMDVRPFRFYFAVSATNQLNLPTNSFFTDWYGNSRYYALVRTDWARLVVGHYLLRFGRNLLYGPAFPALDREVGKIDIGKDDGGAVPASSLTGDADANGSRDFFNGVAGVLEFRDLDISGYRPSPRITGFFSYFDAGQYGGFTNQTDYGGDFTFRFFGDSSAGFTLSSQERADGKFTGTGWSARVNLAVPDLLNVYSEAAGFTGMAVMLGANCRLGPWKASVTCFSADTNYLAPNASDIVHSHRDAQGFFAGLGFGIPGLDLGLSADEQWKLSAPEENPRRTLEFNAVKKLDGFAEWMDGLEIGARSRYSETSSGMKLRSFASGKVVLFNEGISLECGWQDLRNFSVNETGGMATVRARISANGIFSVVLRWNGYSAPSYQSALYDTSEAVYPGDLSVQPYYGRGNELSLVLKWEPVRGVVLNCGVRRDERPDRVLSGFTARTVFSF